MSQLERSSKNLGLVIMVLSVVLLNSCSLKKPGLSADDLQACLNLAQEITNYYNANIVKDATLPTPESPVITSPLDNTVHQQGSVSVNLYIEDNTINYPEYIHHLRLITIDFETQKVDGNIEYYIPSPNLTGFTPVLSNYFYNPGKYLVLVMDQYITSYVPYGQGGFAVTADSPFISDYVCVTVTLPGGEGGSVIPLSAQQTCLDLLEVADVDIVNYDFYHTGKVATLPWPGAPTISSPANLSLLEAGPIPISVQLGSNNFDDHIHRTRLLVMNVVNGNVDADEYTFTYEQNVSFTWTPGPGIYMLLAFDQFVDMTFPGLEVTAESEYIYSNLLCVAVRQMHYRATPGISDLQVIPGILPTITPTFTPTPTSTPLRLPPTFAPTNTPAPACHDYGSSQDMCLADPYHIGGCWWSTDKGACQP
jgi:hypothetical protein